MSKTRIWTAAIVGVVFFGAFAVSCSSSQESRKGGKTAQQEQQAVQTGFNRLQNSQAIPQFQWSQERQTLLDVETIRATGTATTSSGYLEGIGLVWWCPSIGAPVPSTYQLSGSKQWVDLPGDGTNSTKEVDQGEITGVYVGPSSGTWSICLDDAGKKFAKYWEGYVGNTTGAEVGLPPEKRLQVAGITFQFTDKPK